MPKAKSVQTDEEINVTPSSIGNYFISNNKEIEFISSGCTLLNCALGGGYPVGRMINIVGDKSTGKTLLAIEACANFASQFPDAHIWYNEAEAAFDKMYANELGMPLDRITFVKEKEKQFDGTVEALEEHLKKVLAEYGDQKGLYVVDSLDALSDRAEKERKTGEGSFGAQKAKRMSELFRKLNSDLEKSSITLLIISQVRDNIGVTFGSKSTRSGGRALDFYASQVIWLYHVGMLKKSHQKVERSYGVEIKAKVSKNKIGLPFREASFPIEFGYGVDDLTSNIDWLISIEADFESITSKKWPTPLEIKKSNLATTIKKIKNWDDDSWLRINQDLSELVKSRWNNIDKGFLPTRKKYV